MKKIILMVSSVAILASCAPTQSASFKTVDAYPTRAVLTPKYVEYSVDMSRKVSATVEGRMMKGDTQKDWLNKAMVQAISDSNSDFIFEPRTSVVLKGGKITASVTGFAAKYTGTKDVDVRDSVQVVNYVRVQSVSTDYKVDKTADAPKKGFFARLFGK